MKTQKFSLNHFYLDYVQIKTLNVLHRVILNVAHHAFFQK